jgi:hypothetical protein
MLKMQRLIVGLTLTIILSCWVCARTTATVGLNRAQQSGTNTAGELHFKAPAGWVSEKPGSSMRVAQYRLPKTEGATDESEDASLVLYYFGARQAGSVQANVDRWIDQMQQPDAGSSRDKAKIRTLIVKGLKVTTVDVSGTYTAEMSPGSSMHYNKPGYRLRAAVVETPNGAYYVKLVGPEKTVSRWDQSFTDYLNSFEFK